MRVSGVCITEDLHKMCSSLVQHFTCPRTTARSRSCPDPWSFQRLLSIDPATRVKISSILHHGVLPFFAIIHCAGCWTVGMACQQYNYISSFNVYFQRSFCTWHSDFAHFSNFCPDFAIDFDFENNETCAKTSWPYFGVKLRKKLPIVTLRWPNVTLMWTTVALR